VRLPARRPARTDHPRAAGERGRHSGSHQAESWPAGGVGRPPAAQRGRARGLHLGGRRMTALRRHVVTAMLVASVTAAGLAAAEVSVIVREVHSFKVAVIGEVRLPGHYELKSRTTVLDILAKAGPFTDFASRARIFVLRLNGTTKKRIPFNYNKVIAADGEHE